jgi:DNA-binding response OmpR family regulator
LELWADDYMNKPFDMTEFIARIKAILRRNNWFRSEKIILNGFEIYPDEEKVLKNWAQIGLSSLEFKLLMYFLKNKWKILNRQQIYEEVWWDFQEHMFSRTVDVYIWYLRKKLWKDLIKTKKWSWYYIEFQD